VKRADAPVAEYTLEPDAPYSIETPPGHPEVQRWQPPAHLQRLRPALVLLAGESLALPPVRVDNETRLRVVFAAGLPAISPDGLEIEIHAGDDAASTRIYAAHLRPDRALAEPSIVVLSLPPAEALTLWIRCLPGPAGDPAADWLALLEVTVARDDDLDLVAARAFRLLRIDYERRHFGHAFKHPMYVERRRRIRLGIDALIPSERSFAVPGAITNAFDYALARLCTQLAHKAPNFESLLHVHASRKPRLRILSVGTGLGMTEAALLHKVNAEVEMTVIDVNDELVGELRAVLPDHVALQVHVADANDIALPDRGYDIAICVSGVHHLVELGRFFRRVRDALLPTGQLWLIGEQIGLSGNRLDLHAMEEANHLFRSLPERYRRNGWTGEVDACLLNPDRSEAAFEGILSHRIERELARYFRQVHVSRRNCILWRLVGPEYVGNFDLGSPTDAELLDRFVDSEVEYYLAGGRPTELHGVYAPLGRA
jgi:SAM-dependent methyltransferase